MLFSMSEHLLGIRQSGDEQSTPLAANEVIIVHERPQGHMKCHKSCLRHQLVKDSVGWKHIKSTCAVTVGYPESCLVHRLPHSEVIFEHPAARNSGMTGADHNPSLVNDAISITSFSSLTGI